MATDDEANEALVHLTSQLNSELNPQQEELLNAIQMMNSFMKACSTGEILLPVGSCMDGSKVNLPRDHGDVDVLIVSGNIVLSERLFRYMPDNSAFLTIQVKDEHLELFRNVKLVEKKYLPAHVLLEMEQDFFNVIKFVTKSHLLSGSAKGNVTLVRKSKVGFERQDMTGIQSELGGILKMPKQRWGFAEGIYNMLACMNDSIGVMKRGSSKRKISDKSDVEAQLPKETRPNSSQKKTFTDIGDIFTVLGDTINNFRGLGDTDSEGSADEDSDGDSPDKVGNNSGMISISVNDVETANPCHQNNGGNEFDVNGMVITAELDRTNEQGSLQASPVDGGTVKYGKEVKEANIQLSIDEKKNAVGEMHEIGHIEAEDTCDATSDEVVKSDKEVETKIRDEPGVTKDQNVKVATPVVVNPATGGGNEETIPVDYECIESADFVPAFEFTSWPKPAEEWLRRKPRHWPTDDVVREILGTKCQVIVKPLPGSVVDGELYTPSENDVVFRLSFACQELILARSLNETQITCWKILKAFQKSLFETTPRVMTSYLWKNALFWVIEKTEQNFWVQHNMLKCIHLALDFAHDCLTRKQFPQYFVRDMNLVGHCNDIDVQKAVSSIEMLKMNPIGYFREFVENPPKPSPFRVTRRDIQSILQSKDKDHNFGAIKVDILNAFGKMIGRMNDNTESESEKRRGDFERGACEMIDAMKMATNKGQGQTGDGNQMRSLQLECMDSFKELVTDVLREQDGSSDDEESGFPSPLKRVASSMLSLVATRMLKGEKKEPGSNKAKTKDMGNKEKKQGLNKTKPKDKGNQPPRAVEELDLD